MDKVDLTHRLLLKFSKRLSTNTTYKDSEYYINVEDSEDKQIIEVYPNIQVFRNNLNRSKTNIDSIFRVVIETDPYLSYLSKYIRQQNFNTFIVDRLIFVPHMYVFKRGSSGRRYWIKY